MSPEETLSQSAEPDTDGTTGGSAASGIECPACGTHNTTDSKFCRHCGHLLRSLASGTPVDTKKPVVAVEYDDSEEDLTSPAKIDERRAHGLLDRALSLSEHGDLRGAILACRQAIALDHNHAEPYALLGTLLERNGDLRGAMGAYEHVLEIAPDNTLERDSFNRIKARLDKAPAFNFNQDELFATDVVLPVVGPLAGSPESDAMLGSEELPAGIEARLPPTSSALEMAGVPIADSEVVIAPAASVETEAPCEPLVFDFDPTPASAMPSISPLAAALDGETVSRVGMPVPPSPVPAPAVAPSVPKIERRQAQRRQLNLPIAVDHRVVADRRATATKRTSFSPAMWPTTAPTPRPVPTMPASVLTPTQPIAPLDFSFGTPAAAPVPLWARMMRDQSFFVRTLPLIAIAVLGLGFLSWARSQSCRGRCR